MTGPDWVERARELVHEARHRLAPFGVRVADELEVHAENTVLPGYEHDELRIGFCPPVANTGLQRLRWLAYCRTMGAGSLADAERFYDLALPFVVFHEIGHHLRYSTGLSTESPFVEEPVCNLFGMALYGADAGRREQVDALREQVERMAARLGEGLEEQHLDAFVPDLSDQLANRGVLSDRERRELQALAADAGVDVGTLASLELDARAKAEAAAATEHVRHRLDTHYTSDPAAYWYASLSWLGAFLSRRERPTLGEVLRDHFRAAASDGHAGLRLALRAHLDSAHPATRGSALVGLLTHGADPLDPQLVGVLGGPGFARTRVQSALITGLRDGLLQPEQVAPLVDATLDQAAPWGPEEASRMLRLAALTGVECTPDRFHLDPDGDATAAARFALEAAVHRGEDPAPEGPEAATWLADALADRALDPGPGAEAALVALAAVADAEQRALCVHAYRGARRAAPAAIEDLALAELADPVSVQVLSWASVARFPRALPPRGGARWDGLLALIRRSQVWRQGLGDLRGPEHPPRQRFLAAAALCDAGFVEQGALAEPEAVNAFLELARAFDHAGDVLATARPDEHVACWQLARAVLRHGARRTCLQVVRAVAPAEVRDAAGKLARSTTKIGPLPESRVRALLALVPAQLREELNDLLLANEAGEAPPPASLDAIGSDTIVLLGGLGALAPGLWPVLGATLDGLAPLEDPMLICEVERAVHLHGVALFAPLSPGSLRELAQASVVREVPVGASLFEQGSPSRELFLILAGEVEVTRQAGGKRVHLNRLGAGACVGEVGLLDGAPRSATITALRPCTVLTLTREDIQLVGRRHPKVYEELLRVMAARVRDTLDQLSSD